LILAPFALLFALGTALAEHELLGEFHDFRYISGLPGNGFGVTPQGRAGFDGALQMNVPVAYTPSWGNWIGSFSNGSLDTWKPTISTDNSQANGTAFLGGGFGPPGHGLYLANVFTSRSGDPCYNVQYQILTDNFDRPAFAIGCLDFTDRRDSAPGIHRGARSFYGVATGRLGTETKFVYVTLGYGNGRFNDRPFGGISWPVCDKLTLFGEYDGFQANAGFALSPHERLDDAKWNVIILGGLTHMEFPNLGVSLTWNP
jgi:hypothetical protein